MRTEKRRVYRVSWCIPLSNTFGLLNSFECILPRGAVLCGETLICQQTWRTKITTAKMECRSGRSPGKRPDEKRK
jgi:hypothetical protein